MSVESPPVSPDLRFKLGFRVDYADTDAMAIVHHASYFRWLERSRIEWLRAKGLPYHEMERLGIYLPLVSAEIQYLDSLRFDDVAEIKMEVFEVGKSRVEIRYEIWCEGRLTTRAATVHAFVKKIEVTEGKFRFTSTRIPEEWRSQWQLPNAPRSSKSP